MRGSIGRWLLLLLVAIVLGSAGLIVLYEHGGPERLVLRARTAINESRPHPQYVPRPFTAGVPVAHAALSDTNPGDGGDWQPPAATAWAADIATVAAAPTQALSQIRATATPQAAGLRAPGTPAPKGTAAGPGIVPAAPRVELSGIVHYWQTWNNCGPATLASYLSHFGSKISQTDIANVLRPYQDDKNVNPDELVAYARSQGFHALWRVNGNAAQLRSFLSNGMPVIVETWMEPKPNDGMGHYRLVTGYDDSKLEWIVYDSYESTGVDPKGPYRGIRMSYAELDKLWPAFNHGYVLVYTDKEAPLVSAVLGEDLDDRAMWQRALVDELAASQRTPKDAFVRFNVGSDLVALGRYEEAATAYDQARVVGLPWRTLWYQFGPLKAYYEIGRFQEVISLADATLPGSANAIEELFYWKGMALKAKGDAAGARTALQRALKLKPSYSEAAEALAALGN